MLHEHHFRAMNTDVGVWLWSTSRERAASLGRSFTWAEALFARVEDELSRFRSTSALSRLNGAAGRGPQAVPPVLWTVLMSAMEAAEDSGGIYDPTLLRTLERIGYDRTFDDVERCGAMSVTPGVPSFGAWRRVRSDRATRSVSLPADLALDFGGIAKGWTVDRVTLALAPLGPVLVDAGGDLRVIGAVDGEAWPIAVQAPFEPERDHAIVRVSDGALATSSIGGRRWQRGGRTLHHVIDPRTGTAARSDLHAVTVRAPTAMRADVAAKVVLVLGSESGTTYLLERGLSGLLTSVDGREKRVGHCRWEETERHASVHCA
jgi:thiamine biosynthesis lipoprotein